MNMTMNMTLNMTLNMTVNMTGLGQGRPPPRKKEEVVLKAQVVDLKGQAVIGNPNLSDGRSKISVPKFDNDNDNAETDDEDEDVYRLLGRQRVRQRQR
jgi:hypothetical protein